MPHSTEQKRRSHREGRPVVRRWVEVCLLAAAGFGVDLLPVEIFPGIHFVFGSVFSLIAAVRHGPVAGAVAGFAAALPTWSLWNQPAPLSAALYALEGAWVGLVVRRSRWSPLTAVLAYWLLLGSWLNLAMQLAIIGLPLQIAFIIQCRSILNGLLVVIVVELVLLVPGLARRSAPREPVVEGPSFQTLVTLVVTTLISVPILWITVRNARSYVDQRVAELEAGVEREVEALQGQVGALVETYSRGVGLAAEMIERNHTTEHSFLQDLLEIVQEEYPEFAGLYVADEEARTLAFVPPYNDRGEYLVGKRYDDRRYYRDLLETRSMVISDVYQARDGMTEPAVAIGAPVLEEDGELLCFVLGWFDVGTSFQRIVQRFEPNRGETRVVITDRNGRLIADSRLELGAYRTVRDLSKTEDFQIQEARETGTLLVTHEGGKTESPALAVAQASYLLAFTTEPVTGWRIWVHRSLEPVRAAMLRSTTLHLLVLMGTLLLALALSAGLARVVASPLERLRRSAEHLASGDLTDRPAIGSLRTVEIHSLFGSFSRMADALDDAWKRQQQLLNEVSLTKRELEATFDAMTDGVVIIGPDDRILHANPAFYELGSHPAGSVEGRALTELAHGEEGWESCPSCTARRAGESTIAVLTAEENPSGRPIEVRVDPIRDAQGRFAGAVQVIRDLTELRRWEAEAERAGALLRNFVEGAHDAVFALEPDGRFAWANHRTVESLGMADGSVRRYALLDLIHADDRDAVGRMLQEVLHGEARRSEARTVVHGVTRYLLLTLSPVFVHGSITAVLGIGRDVTDERNAAERARRDDKLRALGQLAAGVAHNFNNALTSVLGHLQLARASAEDPRVDRNLETAELGALDAAAMVRRIQQFARSDRAEGFRKTDLDGIVRDALELTRSRWETDAQAGGIRYEVRFPEPTGRRIDCDPTALREVFVNLIINALDAMPGGGELTVAVEAGDDAVSVSVSDTGCGMAPEVRERIFEPFFTTKGPRGQGMGLAVSYGTVQRHDGQIQVESEPAGGARMTVTLPVRQTGPGADRAQAEESTA
ncbi:MAG: ATP-binding protein, partial [Acidobacteriota bacterium]